MQKKVISQQVRKQSYFRNHFRWATVLSIWMYMLSVAPHCVSGGDNFSFHFIFVSLVKNLIKFNWRICYSTVVFEARKHTSHKCMTGLCTCMYLPTWMHSDKAGETAITVKGDSISSSCGVTSFSAGRCGGFGLCLYWPSGPAGLHCEQIPGEWLADGVIQYWW